MNANPGAAVETLSPAFQGELDGIVAVRIRDGQGNDVLERTTDDIAVDTSLGATAIYRTTLTAPNVAGDYWIVWDDGSALAEPQQLRVTRNAQEPSEPTGHDLCTLDDVKTYVPGYVPDDATDQKLQQLITAESELFLNETGLELVPNGDQPATRIYPLRGWHDLIEIGALATTDDLAIDVLNADGDVTSTIDPLTVTPLYDGARFSASAWAPITTLALRTPILFAYNGGAIRVTGTFGYPQIPAFVREAVAGTVILRYASDVANRGTALADAIVDDLISIRGLVIRRQDAIAALAGRHALIS